MPVPVDLQTTGACGQGSAAAYAGYLLVSVAPEPPASPVPAPAGPCTATGMPALQHPGSGEQQRSRGGGRTPMSTDATFSGLALRPIWSRRSAAGDSYLSFCCLFKELGQVICWCWSRSCAGWPLLPHFARKIQGSVSCQLEDRLSPGQAHGDRSVSESRGQLHSRLLLGGPDLTPRRWQSLKHLKMSAAPSQVSDCLPLAGA